MTGIRHSRETLYGSCLQPGIVVLMAMAVLILPIDAQAQSPVTPAPVTARDVSDSQKSTNNFCHIMTVHGAAHAAAPDCQKHTAKPQDRDYARLSSPSANTPLFYPADVFNNGGNVVSTATFTDIYLNSTCAPIEACWGNAEGFQQDMFASTFIHILDQYANSTTSGRYMVDGTVVALSNPAAPHIMQVSDVHAAVIASVRGRNPMGGGGGYTHVYHLFLMPGQDTCLSATNCYSPDNSTTFFFCAYHSSMDATDAIGQPIHVLYTVQPYQNVNGCQDTNTPFPNGQLADSTNSTLSHEIFELVSDPDGSAWWESQHTRLLGDEIGDLCAGEPQKFNLNGKPYDVQLEYDNSSHSCDSIYSAAAKFRQQLTSQ